MSIRYWSIPNWLLVTISASASLLTFAPSPAQTRDTKDWTIENLDRRVQELRHRLDGRMPILAWQLPGIPMNDTALTMRKSGVLQRNIQILWSKGIAPTVNLSDISQGRGTLRGAKAIGATLDELAIPIHLYANPPRWVASWSSTPNGQHRHYPWDYWPPDTEHWFEYPVNFPGELWPVFPLASPRAGYDEFCKLFQGLKTADARYGLAGVQSAAGLWMDYEDLPYPWNGARQSQQHGVFADGRTVVSYYDDKNVAFPGNGRSLKQYYGTDLLSSDTAFLQYTTDLHMWLLNESARKAFVEAYGPKPTGSFGHVFSAISQPFYDLNDLRYSVTVRLVRGEVAMPAIYANNRYLRKYLGGKGQPAANQTTADDVYWHLMLKSFSSSAANAGELDRSLPWVTQYVREDRSGAFDYPMSIDLYQELLRHLWLRGAMGMYVFNPYSPEIESDNVYMTAKHSLDQLEYVRAVMDEMLCFREFLERGMPMNFGNFPMFDHGPVWSGLAYDGRALIRVIAPHNEQATNIAEIRVPDGAAFLNLVVPPGGATYLLEKNGLKRRVDTQSMSNCDL